MATGAHLTRVSWECVHFLPADLAERARQELAETDALLLHVDGSVIQTSDHLFGELATVMQFPEYFGWNWEALQECLRDLKWLEADAYVVFVYHAEQLWSCAPEVAGPLIEVWLSAANHWAMAEVSFHLVFVW